MNERPGSESVLLDVAVAAMRRMTTPDRPSDQLVLDCLRQSETGDHRSTPGAHYKGKRRMSALVRYGIVAAVLSALTLIGFRTHAEMPLLADVVEAVAKHKTVRFETRHETPHGKRLKTNLGALPGGPPRIWTQTTVGTLDRMHARLEDSQGNLMILDRAKGVLLRLDPQQKTGLVSKFAGTQATPGLLELLEDLEKDKATTSTREQLDGLNVVVYRLTKEGMSSTIWVDPQSKLPVRAEMEEVARRHEKTTMTRFAWDPPIANPPKFFSVEPPQGYTISSKGLFRSPSTDKKAKQP
jgi:outer membrane lipoprotein-sorting protein